MAPTPAASTDRHRRRNWNEIADLEEHGAVVTRRKRGWLPIGQASLTVPCAGLDGTGCSALRPSPDSWTRPPDRERLQAARPGDGRPVRAADERDLEERPAAEHVDGTPGVVLDDDE
jgi:hypothetical protein